MKTSESFLVTGALGCVGAWVIRRLVREGVPVVAFDASSDTRRLRLLLNQGELARVKLVCGDIADMAQLEQVLDEHGVTHVVHLAAVLHPRFKSDPTLGARVNVLGSINMFEAVARRAERIRQLVYASSIGAYERTGGVDRHGAPRPGTLYGIYKQAEEHMAHVFFRDRGVSSIGLRPATVFGAGRDAGLSAAPTEAILAAERGQSYRIPYGGLSFFHYADDLAAIFIACARSSHRLAEAFNVGGMPVEMQAFVDAIVAAKPSSSGSISFADDARDLPRDYSDDGLTGVIGTVPCTTLRRAVADTFQIFRSGIASGKLTN